MENALNFLQSVDADIVVLQEANNGVEGSLEAKHRSMQVIRERLEYLHEDFVPDFLDRSVSSARAQRGNGVLSKFPIKDRAAWFFDRPYSETYYDVAGNFHNCPRDLQHVLIGTPAGDVNVFNIQGIWDMDGDNFSPERRKMSEAVLEAIGDKQNVILAGDSNAKPTNPAIKMLEERVVSVFGNSLGSTFNMRRKTNPGYATASVDVIFVSPEIKVLEQSCPDVDVSDHLPLVAKLRLPNN